MRKISFFKKLDSIVGVVIARLLPHAKFVSNDTVVLQRVLFIRPGGIGDAVLLIPAIQSLKEEHPHCLIDILAEKRNSQIFSLCQSIRRVYRYDHKGGTGAIFEGIAADFVDKINFNHDLICVDLEKKQLWFANGQTANYDSLISTIPLDQLIDKCTNVPMFVWRLKNWFIMVFMLLGWDSGGKETIHVAGCIFPKIIALFIG